METSQIQNLDTKQLAIVILHLNLGKAFPYFPGSTRAHPSQIVVVTLTSGGPLDERFLSYFPVQVIWHLWENVVYPVTLDPDCRVITETGSLRNYINVQYVREGNYDPLLEKIESRLLQKLQETGYIPVGTVPEEGTSDPEEDLIDLSEEEDGIPEETDDTRWAEGHLRLTYPVVD